MVTNLVHRFYELVLEEETLGPIFHGRLSHRWDEHLATMVDFWSSVVLSTGRYGGKPHAAHHSMGLSPEHFRRWLDLFEQTAVEVCGDAAPFFVDRAHRISASLMIGLSIGPKALKFTGSPRLKAAT
jgi:hemoglobin